jgi:hypothetical protein
MRIIQLPSIVLLGLTTSWAVPAAARPVEDLAGSWRGTFWQVNAGDTGYVHGSRIGGGPRSETTATCSTES